jgi:uncharacterized protein
MNVVGDTSSISNLFQIGLIDILHAIFGELLITPAVRRELFMIPEQESNIEGIDWIKVKSPQNQKLVVELQKELDLGEAESIVLALESKADYLLIDEYKGRKIANENGIKIVGILGVLIKAKYMGLIPSVKSKIDDLIDVGFRLDKNLITNVLISLGEQ